MYKRKLDLEPLLKDTSYFLFGPRATGKSSLSELLDNTIVFDLLDSDVYEELLRRPKALEEKITDPKKNYCY